MHRHGRTPAARFMVAQEKLRRRHRRQVCRERQLHGAEYHFFAAGSGLASTPPACRKLRSMTLVVGNGRWRGRLA